MSLLDDARKLAGFGPYFKRGDEAICWYCRETVVANAPYHAPDCPWLSMPKIVAALEAAERVTEVRAVVLEEAVTDLEIALKGEST